MCTNVVFLDAFTCPLDEYVDCDNTGADRGIAVPRRCLTWLDKLVISQTL